MNNVPWWTAIDTDNKRVRLTLQEVIVLEIEGENIIKWKGNVVDGENVRKSYKMVSLKEVKALEFHV